MNKYSLFTMFLMVTPVTHAAVEFDTSSQVNAQNSAYLLPEQPVPVRFDTAGGSTDNYAFSVTSMREAPMKVEMTAAKQNEDLLNLTVVDPKGSSRSIGHSSESAISYASLGPENYLLQINSETLAKKPVTESSLSKPSALALMMAGFGLVGFMSNRRRQLV